MAPQPRPNQRSGRFGLFPVRSPLLRESRLLSFPRATEMFHFARFASEPYYPPCGRSSGADDSASAEPGCPIRRSRDLGLLDGSPGLIAAFHVLHRLSAPRHPPCTLVSLTLDRHFKTAVSSWLSTLTLLLFTCQRAAQLRSPNPRRNSILTDASGAGRLSSFPHPWWR